MAEWDPFVHPPALRRDPWYIRVFPGWMLADPWEAFIGFLGTVSAIPLILGQRPASIERLLPLQLQIAWAVMLFCGCLLVLVGLGTKKVLLERLGLQIFGPSTIVYGAAVLIVGGWQGVGAFFPYCLFAVVSYLQAYKLRKTFMSGARFVDRNTRGEAE